MIDEMEFEPEIKRFFSYFNKRINETIMDFWFSKLKYGSIVSIRKGFDSFKYSNKFPDLSDVINKCRDIQSENNTSRYHIKKQIECAYCSDIGFIIYIKKDTNYSFVARCRCPKGQRQDRSILDMTDINPDYYKNKGVASE
jgi:hypothetical protein